MKLLLASLITVALLSGCASTGNGRPASAQTGNNAYGNDPTLYPGTGVHLGIGIGRFGRRNGAAAGIGYGW